MKAYVEFGVVVHNERHTAIRFVILGRVFNISMWRQQTT